MLADTLTEIVAQRQTQTQADQSARQERDAFIKLNFEQLDADFSAMIDAVTGVHPLLAVVKTPLVDVVSNRAFADLNKTMIEVRSTLYGNLEVMRFTPALRFVQKDQFGVVEIEPIDLPMPQNGNQGVASLQSMLKHGVLLRGAEQASLVVAKVPEEEGFEVLTEELLEQLLETAFVRTK